MTKKTQPKKKSKINFEVDDTVLATVRRLAYARLSIEQIGEYFGLNDYEWIVINTKHPEIEKTFLMGKSGGIAFAAEKLIEHIENDDLKATIFYLETKGGFNKPDPKLIEIKKEQQESITETLRKADGQIESSRTYCDIITRS